MDTLTSIVTLSIVWAVILFVFLSLKTKRVSKYFMLSMIGTIFIFIVIFGSYETYEYTESAEFCGISCHPMDTVYVTFRDNPHNSSMMKTHTDRGINCADCHNEKGLIGAVKSRIEGMRSFTYYIRGDYDVEHMGDVIGEDAQYCMKGTCHDNVDWVLDGVGNSTPIHKDIEEIELCGDCHDPHNEGIDLNKDACGYCHDVSDEQLDQHEEYVYENFVEIVGENIENTEKCTNCHHAKEKIPYMANTPSEFCASCHEEQNNELIAYGGEHLEYLGNCSSCHETHQNIQTCWSGSCHPNEAGPWLDNVYASASNNEFLRAYSEDDTCSNCHPATMTGIEKDHTNSFDYWPGRGTHVNTNIANENCVQCHDAHKTSLNRYTDLTAFDNKGCANGCHNWFEPEDRPEFLLENTNTKHKTLYDEDNCTGLCHLDNDVDVEDIHSNVSTCMDEACHMSDFSSFLTGPGHISHSNVAQALGYDCYTVCHDDKGEYITPGCYECHYSGHDPRISIGGG